MAVQSSYVDSWTVRQELRPVRQEEVLSAAIRAEQNGFAAKVYKIRRASCRLSVELLYDICLYDIWLHNAWIVN